MAPTTDNESTPKAPDKTEKPQKEKLSNKSLSNLNDGELKDLLDEAMTYINPKDREGKSPLFKELLKEAEESERNARATRAGGSQLVRYCNTTAKRSKNRRKRQSVSENMMHGGSLDNLADLEVTNNHNRPKKTVSARQKEGGSLPSNVNVGGLTVSCIKDNFLEDAKQRKKWKDEQFTVIDMESESLLAHDSLAHNYNSSQQAGALRKVEGPIPQIPPKYTTKATLQINVDEVRESSDLDPLLGEKTDVDIMRAQALTLPSQANYTVYNLFNNHPLNLQNVAKKVDENGNHQNMSSTKSTKKKKTLTDKNVVCLSSEKVAGHRSDIIDDMDKLLEYIGESPDSKKSTLHRSKLHKHTSEDGAARKKQRAHSTKGKEPRSELKKCNSLNEISTTNLDEFAFEEAIGSETGVVLRNKGGVEKQRERRSWGNMEAPVIQDLYKHPSMENVETADFRVVTKKKKTKKRRNSVSSSRRKPTTNSRGASGTNPHTSNRTQSPDLRRKSTCSVPHSEKSDSASDVDSVHSLPIDTKHLNTSLTSNDDNAPISYADIAKNAAIVEKINKEKKNSPEKDKEKPPIIENHISEPLSPEINTPPDVHNFKSFPAIQPPSGALASPPTTVKTSPLSQIVVKNNKNVNNTNVKAKQSSVLNNNHKNRNGAHKVAFNNHLQGDLQADLTIIQANDLETIQFNNQIMPVNIPDVTSIEKMHFNQIQRSDELNSPLKFAEHRFNDHYHLPPISKKTSTKDLVNGLSVTLNPSQQVNTRINNNNNKCARAEGPKSDIRPEIGEGEEPAVVILSGMDENKSGEFGDVGLEFGFDVNEELLSEDICENFISRFVSPDAVYNNSSHNHDKIVNFIGLAWEDIIKNQHTGKVQYYSSENS